MQIDTKVLDIRTRTHDRDQSKQILKGFLEKNASDKTNILINVKRKYIFIFTVGTEVM